MTSAKSKYVLSLRGFANAPIGNVNLERCTFDNVAKDDLVENVKGLTLTDVSVNHKIAKAPA